VICGTFRIITLVPGLHENMLDPPGDIRNKISVIVPTMWKCAFFPAFLDDLVNHELVEDIIIIDNDTYNKHTIPKNSKIQLVSFGTNIFVNPAWNLGVYLTKAPIICFANDDIIFDLRIFDKISQQITMDHGCYGLNERHEINGDIFFDQYGYEDLFGFGQLMFIHRKNWIDIPEEINVYYGDNFIFDVQATQGKPNFLIKNLLYYTPHAQTTGGFGWMLNNEGIQYAKICQNRQLKRLHP